MPVKLLDVGINWQRLDQRQWKDLVAQLNGRKPEPELRNGNRNRRPEPGLATVRWCTHTAARRRPPVIAGVVVFGDSSLGFNC